MATTGDDVTVEDRRLAVVLEHVAAENAQDIERALWTFHHPRYEIVPTGFVADGEAAVRDLLRSNWAAMPGLRFSAEAVYHGPAGVAVETRTEGTHAGRPVDMLSVNVFVFDDDRLVCERCFFDQVTTAAIMLGSASERSDR